MTEQTLCPLCAAADQSLDMTWDRYRLERCANCDLVFANPLETPPELYHAAYSSPTHWYQGYYRQAKEIPKRRFHVAWAWRHFFNLVHGNGGRLLDIGCSTGAFMAAASDRGWKPEGIDVSKEAVEVAREATGAVVHTGTLQSCNFPDDTFEVVSSWEVLEHVTDPIAFAKEVYRVLKPGGYWTISTPNWRSRWERATTEVSRRPPFHVTYWNAKTLGRLLRETGFEVIATREKPFAWQEEVGARKWLYLPVALFRGFVLRQKANRLFALGRKAGQSLAAMTEPSSRNPETPVTPV